VNCAILIGKSSIVNRKSSIVMTLQGEGKDRHGAIDGGVESRASNPRER